MKPSVGLMSGSGLVFLMMMIWQSGRGGLALNWRWRVICSCTILGAERLWGMGSMLSACWMRTHGGLQLSGGMLFRGGGGWGCGLGGMGRGLAMVKLLVGWRRSITAMRGGCAGELG